MIKHILFVGIFAFSAVACGGNECEDAADKAQDECGIKPTAEQQKEIDEAKEECSGIDECAAKCVNDASCAEIKAQDANSSYGKCVLGCASRG